MNSVTAKDNRQLTALVTFDFHNTIAFCDTWFSLEIRELPVRTLDILVPDIFEDHSRDGIVASYRSLRQQVMSSGKEVDAVEGVRRVTAGLGLNLNTDDIAVAIADLMREASAESTPVPGAVESIQAIVAEGIAVGVISSAVYHPFLEWSLEKFGIADDLAFVITSASSGHYKSNPEIYRTAIRAANADVNRSIHVGDSERWDVWSAKQAGMRAVWFANGKVDSLVDRPLETQPDHTVSSMADVAPWILENLETQS